MRARYTAYVNTEIDFLKSSLSPDEQDAFDPESTKAWAQAAEWRGLTIKRCINGQATDTTGAVEFEAKYLESGMLYTHAEFAEFEKIEDKWYFKDGKVKPSTVVRDQPKVGRNDPCPCGNGKKYKKCCGK